MIPNDPILTTDPFDAICTALSTQLMSLVPSLKNAVQGWPDPKWFEDTGANFPSVFFVMVSDKGKSMTSRNLVFASVKNPDGSTANVYYERERLQYLLQISLFTTDPQERLDIGWAIKQYLINTMQLPINAVDTARFVYTGHDHMPEGRDNFYQRDIGFEVTARVLDGSVANLNKTIQQNNTVS
ncbi:hypothetical protein LLE49_19510 [Alicyclobacillus tolerans]|uniref:hypothetical protein n=1 Tax=Alicyclobacillus tolerans TaxID=90970 RepID=UPI001F2DE9EA|nr:hypothetical protein [Alicyclobacillus tolerans]MCF8566910.1 hypothetical protein [Alicyclobacillus tolerans]